MNDESAEFDLEPDEEPVFEGCPVCGGGPPLISCVSGIGNSNTLVTCGDCGHRYELLNELPGDA